MLVNVSNVTIRDVEKHFATGVFPILFNEEKFTLIILFPCPLRTTRKQTKCIMNILITPRTCTIYFHTIGVLEIKYA